MSDDLSERLDLLGDDIRDTITFHLSAHFGAPEQRAQAARELTDAVMPHVRAAFTAAHAETGRFRRQAQGYRGMRDIHLRERNTAHAELIKAENIIERLCEDREAGQQVVKSTLTEQRERAEEAEATVERVRDLADQFWTGAGPARTLNKSTAELIGAVLDDRLAAYVTGRDSAARAEVEQILGAERESAERVEEAALPVDWEAEAPQRERELKAAGEARHQAEAALRQVWEWFLQPHPTMTADELNQLSTILHATRTVIDQPEETP